MGSPVISAAGQFPSQTLDQSLKTVFGNTGEGSIKVRDRKTEDLGSEEQQLFLNQPAQT
jgi:hypothetical protein